MHVNPEFASFFKNKQHLLNVLLERTGGTEEEAISEIASYLYENHNHSPKQVTAVLASFQRIFPGYLNEFDKNFYEFLRQNIVKAPTLAGKMPYITVVIYCLQNLCYSVATVKL